MDLYGIDELTQSEIASDVGSHPGSWPNRQVSDPEAEQALSLPIDELIHRLVERDGASRSITKLCFYANRQLELAAQYAKCSPASLVEWRRTKSFVSKAQCLSIADMLLSLTVGVSFGRWDIRYATGERQPPELPDPFDPLPVCPPGMLQNAEGLPAEPKDVPADYPLRISWPGILVDDENHPEDIVARVREAIEVIWQDRAEAIEQEACEILGVKTLRDYFRRPAAFFADHLKRYSKSRRKAPIYWPLSTKSGSYTLWLYYHRLNDQTLYVCVNDFVEPKIQQVADNLGFLSKKSHRSSDDEKQLSLLSDLKAEMEEFRDDLLRGARYWKPNLNDGVQITAAPLWAMFCHKPWQNALKDTWAKLEKGDYDWAHLAMNYWPDRVREKCKTDKSLAIAHGLEDLYVEPEAKPKKARQQEGKRGVMIIRVHYHSGGFPDLRMSGLYRSSFSGRF